VLAAIVISGLAFFFGNGLHPLWWLMWLAPIPALVAAGRASARVACTAAFLSFFLGGLTWWGYFHILELPISVRLLAFIGPSLIFAFAVMMKRELLRRSHRWAAALALPTIWVSFDYLSSLGRNGTALNLSYSQMNFLPILQVASITGIWGIEFTVFFFASAAAVAICTRRKPGVVSFTTISLAVVALVLGFGVWRLSRTATGEQVTIGLASSDQHPLLAKDEAGSAALVRDYAKSIDDLATKGAKIVVIPEKIGPVFSQSGGSTLNAFSEAAQRNNVILVVGVDQPDTPLKHNLAFVYGPDGNQLLVYEKHFMVPDWEDGYERGNKIARFPAPHTNWGVVICKDMDFPALSRHYANQGVQLMFAPAWDFVVDDWLHGRMAVLRGVESGFAIARSAKQGLMTISDNRGRILAQEHSADSGPAKVIGTITLSPERTLYSRLGDWFAWLNLAALAGLILLRLRKMNIVSA
jgi:apolipoprotein N-acyltransferase